MKKPDVFLVNRQSSFGCACGVLCKIEDLVRCDTFAEEINVDRNQVSTCIDSKQMPRIQVVCHSCDLYAI